MAVPANKGRRFCCRRLPDGLRYQFFNRGFAKFLILLNRKSLKSDPPFLRVLAAECASGDLPVLGKWRLHGGHHGWFAPFIRGRLFPIQAQRLPGAMAQFSKEAEIQREINPQPFRNAKHPLTMGYIFENLLVHSLREFNHVFLVPGWAKMPQ